MREPDLLCGPFDNVPLANVIRPQNSFLLGGRSVEGNAGQIDLAGGGSESGLVQRHFAAGQNELRVDIHDSVTFDIVDDPDEPFKLCDDPSANFDVPIASVPGTQSMLPFEIVQPSDAFETVPLPFPVYPEREVS